MEIALVACRVVLAAVLLIAGVGKLMDLAGSRKGVAWFGIPPRLAEPIGTALPFIELGLGLALLPAATAWGSALASLLLLLGFTVGMLVALGRGQQPDCHCFGAIHSEPVSRGTVIRNVALVVMAAFVVTGGRGDPGPGVYAWLDGASTGDAVLVGAGTVVILTVIAGTLVARKLIHRLDQIQASLGVLGAMPPVPVAGGTGGSGSDVDEDRILGIPVGTPAPPFEATSLTGTEFSLEHALHRGRQLLLVFVNPDCSACERLLPRIARWHDAHREWIDILAISHGDEAANRDKAERLHFPQDRYLLQDGRAVSDLFGVERVPIALHLAPDGGLMSPVAGGADAIVALLDTIGSRGPVPDRNPIALQRVRTAFRTGDAMPQVTAMQPGVGPTQVPIPMRQTLVMFWSPSCPFCQRLLPELLRWETFAANEDVVTVLSVQSGQADATRAQGVVSMIVEDDGEMRAHYEVNGTPVAALIDRDGRLEEPMAIGMGAVRVLLQRTVERLPR